ncbi:hypothetical protein CRG98_040095 [Punica granatum]|uniref:MULE transposase domain-containing protein n=1 Tax=Punica granatum TaxID=22663 RepID=A0A2I0I6K8_PUNGR|nr:hypothetical protein CRG98_040095 [Punica granatum]
MLVAPAPLFLGFPLEIPPNRANPAFFRFSSDLSPVVARFLVVFFGEKADSRCVLLPHSAARSVGRLLCSAGRSRGRSTARSRGRSDVFCCPNKHSVVLLTFCCVVNVFVNDYDVGEEDNLERYDVDRQEDQFEYEGTEHVDLGVYWDEECIFNDDAEGHLGEEEEHLGDRSDSENGEEIVVRLPPTTANMVISYDEEEGYISEELVDKCISDDDNGEEELRKYPKFDEKATFGEGFKEGCRPFIGLDECFLKGYYGGQLLSAVAQDVNRHFYVIAVAVVEQESRDTWSWFLRNLLGDIGQYSDNGWNFISDQ